MDFDNLSFDSDLDALLAEVKGYTSPFEPAPTEASTGKDWSMDDIDALIAGLDSPADEATLTPAEPAPEAEEKQEEYKAKEPVVFPDEDVPVDSYFRMDAKPEPVVIDMPEPEIEEVVDEAKPTLTYDSALSDDDIDSLVSSLFGEIMLPEEEEEPAVQEEPAPQQEPEIEQEDEPEESEHEEEPEPEETEQVEQAEEKLAEIHELPTSGVRRVSAFVINEAPAVEQEEEEEEFDPEKIPVYDPLAEYMARQKESEQPGMVTDKNRETFLNHIEIEQTEEADNDFLEPFDKPGIIITKNRFEMTSDLDPLPTVMSADKAKADARTKVVGGVKPAEPAEPAEEEFPGQIKLSGFEPVPEEQLPEDTAEEELEAMLIENRRHKARDFRIVQDDENVDDDAIPFEKLVDDEIPAEALNAPAEESKGSNIKSNKKQKGRKLFTMSADIPAYNEPADRKHVHAALNATGVISLRQIAVDAAIALVMLIFNIVPFLATDSELFCKGGIGVYVANAILLIAAMVFNSKIIFSGFNALTAGKPDASSAAALTAVAAFVHNTVAAAVEMRQGGTSPAFAMLGVIAFAVISFSDNINARRIIKNFEMCAYRYEKNLYTIYPFEDESEVRELSRGVLLDSADILYSSKTEFPADFLKNSSNSKAERRAVSRILPISAIAAVVTGAIAGFITKDFMSAANALFCTFCLTSPVYAALVPATAARSAGKALGKDGACITGTDTAGRFVSTNAVVIDSCDIFNRDKCRMHGMVDFKQIRVDDLLVYAAALVIKSGGPLRECFESVISEDHNLLPTVRDIAYEDKLGVSARIHSQKVLLGNRLLLENHGVEVPDKSLEEKYTSTGKRVLYLSVCGKLAAMFVVSYAVDLNLRPYLEKLEDSGVTIMVRTNDVNVTEDLLSRGFGLPKSAFCVLGSVAGRLFTRRRDEVTDSASVHIAHNGNAFSMVRAITAAHQLYKNAEFGIFFQLAISVTAFVLCAILAATGSGLGAITSALVAAVATAISYFITDLYNRKD